MLPCQLPAQTRDWISSAGGRYDIDGNWRDGIPPSATEDARFGLDNDYTVIWNASTGNTVSRRLDIRRGNVVFASRSGNFLHRAGNFSIDTGSSTIPAGSLTLGDSTGSAFRIESSRHTSARVVYRFSTVAHSRAQTVSIDGIGTDAGLIRVSGAGSRLVTTNELNVGLSGPGRLTIESGGAVQSDDAEIGRGSAADGYEARLRGSGSSWTDTGVVVLIKGLFDISAGATFNSNRLAIRAGEMRVSGESTWENMGIISLSGGTLDLASGAKIVSNSMRISQGAVSVSGNTLLDLNTELLFDGAGGTLSASTGAEIMSATGHLGESAGTRGTVELGGGSNWINSAALQVGNAGTGILNLRESSQLSAESLQLGNLVSGVGQMTLNSGSSSTIDQKADVGVLGQGELSILEGSTFHASRTTLGVETSGIGTTNVNGSGAMLTTSEDLVVGLNGTGSINVLAGGNISNSNGILGSETSSSGTAVIDGVGSHWINNGNLEVGRLAQGGLRSRMAAQLLSEETLRSMTRAQYLSTAVDSNLAKCHWPTLVVSTHVLGHLLGRFAILSILTRQR